MRDIRINHLEESEKRGRGTRRVCPVYKSRGLWIRICVIERDMVVLHGDLNPDRVFRARGPSIVEARCLAGVNPIRNASDLSPHHLLGRIE